MTRVDFYILPSEGEHNRRLVACKLAEKAYKRGHRVYIHTGSPQASEQVDGLLWTFRQGSFVPHALLHQTEAEHTPVLIGHDAAPENIHEVLVNLAGDVPSFFSRFERVAEVVDAADSSRHQGRERFRFYRDRGYGLQTHELGT